MLLPPLILGATIIFWGWQTNLWFLALPMALLYEISFLLNWRWHFKTAHFRQVSNLCTILLVVVLIYLWNKDGSLQFIFLFFQWLPLVCFPLVLAQAYSDSEGVDLRALLFLKEKPQDKSQAATIISLHYPFLAICLVSASAGNTRDIAFYIGMTTLLASALWYVRSRRSSAIAWIMIIFLATTVGFFGHTAIHHAHLSLEKKTLSWVRQFYRYHSSNPNQRNTAIGDIGAVKLTNKIVLRVKPSTENLEPKLLRRITYNNYSSGIWIAVNAEFQPLNLAANTVDFLPSNQEISPNTANSSISNRTNDEITIYRYLEEGKNLLNLPTGIQKINKLSVEEAAENQYGTVQVESKPRLASYRVVYNPSIINDSLPTQEDLEIPKNEIPTIKQIASQLNLKNKSQSEILDTVHKFFNTEFTYSLKLARQGHHKTPVSAFLLDNRSGHCEYFATAAALLLREAGIPTRYAIGYSVHEYSSLEKQFIVRGKNAHAWNLVYVDGAWQYFDATPSDWIEAESNMTSNPWLIGDILSLIGFKISQFSEFIQALSKTKSFWLVAIPLVIILLWWLLRRKNLNDLQLQRVINESTNYIATGTDSEIYLIEQALQKSQITRHNHESWQPFIARLQENNQLPSDLIDELTVIAKLHYRYRFDPQGISQAERAKLKSATDLWLAKYSQLIAEAISSKS